MSSEDGTITQQIAKLKTGDEEALRVLWEHHFQRLTAYARQRLADSCRRVADEEDVAASALGSLFRGATTNRFPNLQKSDDLWRLLLVIAQRKAIALARRQKRQKRGGDQVRGESALMRTSSSRMKAGIDGFAAAAPDPEYIAILEEEHQRLFDLLQDDLLRQIAIWKMQSYTNEEIAGRLSLTSRTVERKLRLIRSIWSNAEKDAIADEKP